ncbi:MAG: hypothetical protein K6E75_08455 [Lachnospiraceae bacterium]|nr:hypothetical protein [Lachnospiraceae bacterium]
MNAVNKYIKQAILLAGTAVLLGGCAFGKKELPQESGISIDKKGVITQVIVEGFAESYYNADELKSEIESQVALISQSGEAGYGGSVYVGGGSFTPVNSVSTVGGGNAAGEAPTQTSTTSGNQNAVSDTSHLGAGAMIGGGYNPSGSSQTNTSAATDTGVGTDDAGSVDTVTSDNGDFVINGAGAGAFSGSGSFSAGSGSQSSQVSEATSDTVQSDSGVQDAGSQGGSDLQDDDALGGSGEQDAVDSQDITTRSASSTLIPSAAQPSGQQVLFPQRKLTEDKKKKKEGELPIRLTDFELSETKILRVELEFDDSNYYSSFNNRGLFVGHIQEAIDTGFAFPAVYATDGSGQASVDAMASEKKRTIVIFEEATEIVTPRDIAYRSENVTVTDQVHASVATDGDVGIVIY